MSEASFNDVAGDYEGFSVIDYAVVHSASPTERLTFGLGNYRVTARTLRSRGVERRAI